MNIRLMLVFPGQGSQYIGMVRKLSADYDKADYFISHASKYCGFDIESICEHSDDNTLTETRYAQPALLLTEYLAYRKLSEKFEINPIFLAGHSLGEISALTCSGAIDFRDAVKLVTARGEFMFSEGGNGTMAAVLGISEDEIHAACKADGSVVISNYNSPKQIIISGSIKGIERVSLKMAEKGALVKPLKVSGAFHSPQMTSAAERLSPILNTMDYNYFAAPVIANYDAKPYSSPDLIADRLKLQLTNSVRWTDTIKYATKMGINTVIEIGPNAVLKGLISNIEPNLQVYSIDDPSDYERIVNLLPIKKVQGCDFNKVVMRSLGIAVCIKNNNTDSDEYERGVIAPYKDIQNIKSSIESRETGATEEEARSAVSALKKIMDTKKADADTKRIRIHQLLREANALEKLANLLYSK